MRLAELVAEGHAGIDVDAAMADVAALCWFDRYQASAGILDAADHVAERMTAVGLADVRVLRFPADGAQRWWSYAGPPGWTPVRASVTLDGRALLRYPEQPYTLAAYSAATTAGGVPAVLSTMDDAGSGSLVLLEEPHPGALGELAQRGVLGVVIDPLSARRDREPGQVGRLELPPGSPLVAFSASADVFAALAGALGRIVHVDVALAPAEAVPDAMPVVTGRLGGSSGAGEVLLTAHLCHPMPSANDNASGVAALLAAADWLTRRGGDGPAVRLLCGPEFLGTAAYLHDLVHNGQYAAPTLGINVDMAGEDPLRCGSTMVVERSPDELPSWLSALVVHCAHLLPAPRSYSGAVALPVRPVRETPHLGASDHALLVAPPTRCPAVGIGHWPDRFNHSSADTLDKVDAIELRRTAAVVAASVAAIRAARGDAELRADLLATTRAWAVSHVATASTRPLLDHRLAVAVGSLRGLTEIGLAGAETERAVEAVTGVHAALAPGTPAPQRSGDGRVLAPSWDGPFNLRALAGAAPPGHRALLDRWIAADRGGTYARLTAIARGVDGRRDRHEIAAWAALASELPIALEWALTALEIMAAAGWVEDV